LQVNGRGHLFPLMTCGDRLQFDVSYSWITGNVNTAIVYSEYVVLTALRLWSPKFASTSFQQSKLENGSTHVGVDARQPPFRKCMRAILVRSRSRDGRLLDAGLAMWRNIRHEWPELVPRVYSTSVLKRGHSLQKRTNLDGSRKRKNKSFCLNRPYHLVFYKLTWHGRK
jgi:hypothetical protein